MAKDDRHQWIEVRAGAGEDFTDLVRALSRLVVTMEDGELIVDASALNTEPHYPERHSLIPATDHGDEPGHWGHDGSGESGPLVEMLMVVALLYIKED